MARPKRSDGTAGTSAGNARLLTLARDLQRRKGRERRSLFVVEGVRGVEEVVRARLPMKGAIVSPQLEEAARGRSLLQALEHRAPEIARVSARELASVADTESPQGVVAIAEIPTRSLDDLRITGGGVVLVLDGVQDPGNVGTILRTAAAFGARGVVALPGTVDLWNPKVVRGAMGAHFHTPGLHVEPPELFDWLRRNAVELWVSDMQGEPIAEIIPPARVAVIVGNEGAGVGASVRDRAARTVSLPLAKGVESLNVAVAAGIMLFVLRERQGPT